MIESDCPFTQRKCDRNKCPYQIKYVVPFKDDDGSTNCVVIAGYCSATDAKEEIMEGYCIYE